MSPIDPISFLKGSSALYLDAAKKATQSTAKNWIIPLASIAAFLAFLIASALLGGLPGTGGGLSPQGIILGLIFTALLSIYYGWISAAVNERKVSLRELVNLDGALFLSIMSVLFILFLLNLVLHVLLPAPQSLALLSTINFGIFIAFNALPEVIYLQKGHGSQAFSESIDFLKDNWPEWFIPLLILLLPSISIVGSQIFPLLSLGQPLIPPGILLLSLLIYLGAVSSISSVLSLVIGVIIVTWFMIFRGILFKKLSSGSRRQRAFMMRQ